MISAVAICTGRVEAKLPAFEDEQRLIAVAICTGRVEAKTKQFQSTGSGTRCNLHGACGGKEGTLLQAATY